MQARICRKLLDRIEQLRLCNRYRPWPPPGKPKVVVTTAIACMVQPRPGIS